MHCSDFRFTIISKEPVKSQTVWGKGYCDFGLKHRVREKKVTQEFINYLQTHSLVVELWGSQGTHLPGFLPAYFSDLRVKDGYKIFHEIFIRFPF